ncbi:MAG: hypothetical protein IMZ66_09515 [Planctomycetes bacterium]|nr:hypothetical protein [Planctomycetota bacterium]
MGLALGASAAFAEERAGPAAGSEKRTPEAIEADELLKVADIEADLASGKYDAVIEAGGSFIRKAHSDKAKAECNRLVAVALRKKQDWKRAMGAYLRLRDCYPRGSDEYIRYGAMGDILRASPTGVYLPSAGPKAEGATAATATGKNLADDAVMDEALAQQGAKRLEKLKVRVQPMRRGRSSQEIIKLYAALVDELRQARALWPEMPPDVERDATQAAGQRLAEVGKQAIATMTAKSDSFQETIAGKRLSSGQRKDMGQCQEACTELAKTELAFPATMAKLPSTADWPEGDKLQADSAERMKALEELAKALTPPAQTTGGGDWGGAAGAGGGGGAGGRGAW